MDKQLVVWSRPGQDETGWGVMGWYGVGGSRPGQGKVGQGVRHTHRKLSLLKALANKPVLTICCEFKRSKNDWNYVKVEHNFVAHRS